jgi:HPt (histidine-containing phosphotransfer) domain-containing protein
MLSHQGPPGSGLRDRFLVRAARDASRLEDLLPRLPDGRSDGIASAIEQLAHGLAGAGGSFGFPDISTLAGIAEAQARRLSAGDGDPARLEAACRDLLRALAALPGRP